MYSGSSSSYSVYDPSTEVGSSSQAFTLQPAHVYGTIPSNVGVFLFDSGWEDSGNGDDYIEIIRVENPLNNPSFSHQFINLGDVDYGSVPQAPQNGTSDLIDFGDDRAQSCVWRDDRLVGAFTVNPPSGTDADQATVLWFDVNTTNLSNLSLSQSGMVGGEDIASNTYTSYPAISLNQDGDIAIGFSASASSIYAGAYYTIHKSTDAAGTVQPSQTLHAGLDQYYRVFSGSRNRWGDYSSIALDPSDEMNFWVFNQYAWTRGSSSGGDGRWKTCFAEFGTVEVPQYLKADQITATGLTLHWAGRSAEFRLLKDGNEIYSGNDTTYTVSGLNAATTYSFDVYGKASGQSVYSTDHINLSVTTASSSNETNPTAVISATPTIESGNGSSEFEIKDTGIWLTFPSGVTASTQFTAAKKTGDPGISGSLPTGIVKIATDRNWTVSASAGTNVGTYTIRFDLTGMTGIDNFNTLKILKRADASSAWENVEDLGATLNYNEPYISVSGLTSFSDFVVASTGDNSLPVTLSAFSADVMNGSVILKWRTESELENMGFIIKRSEDNGRNYRQLDDYQTSPALKGAGNASYAHNYSYLDSTVEAGKTYWYKLEDVSLNGNVLEHGPVKITIAAQKGFFEKLSGQTVPKTVTLYPNFPNPFNPVTHIVFAIPQNKENNLVTLTVFDLNGKKIKNLLHQRLSSGKYELRWEARDSRGRNVSSGMYLLVLKVGNTLKSRKLLLLK